MQSKRPIYLDYVSTTPLHPEVFSTYTQLLNQYYANSDSMHDLGMEVNKLQQKARQQIADLLTVKQNEVIFTSGASESNNLAIKGVAFSYQSKGKHLITTQIEHSSVLHCFEQLQNEFGFEVTYLSVDENGVIDISELRQAIRKDTILVSIMYINNEVGSIMPISQIKEIVKKESNAFLHVDCVQALGKYPIDLIDVDLASFSAHKIFGLKGSGVLIRKQHIQLMPLIVAGQQEQGIRGGTSNALVNIVFAKTLRLALESQKEHFIYVEDLNHYLKNKLSTFSQVRFHSTELSSVYILNFSIVGITSEVMMNALNNKGIYVSAQSTCSSKSKAISHVLMAMNVVESQSISAIRVGLSHLVSKEDIDALTLTIKECIELYGK